MYDKDLIIYCAICVCAGLGSIAAVFPFVLARLVRPATRIHPRTLQSYECGNLPFGQSWDFRHGIAFYIYALIFLAFEVDILYLFPVALAFGDVAPVRGVLLLGGFVFMLACGLAYAWFTGVFTWTTRKKIY